MTLGNVRKNDILLHIVSFINKINHALTIKLILRLANRAVLLTKISLTSGGITVQTITGIHTTQ